MSETKTLELSDVVAAAIAPLSDEVSCYKAIVTLNGVLDELGSTAKARPTQMGYNYNRNGMLGVKGSNVVAKDELGTWIVKYITKNANKLF